MAKRAEDVLLIYLQEATDESGALRAASRTAEALAPTADHPVAVVFHHNEGVNLRSMTPGQLGHQVTGSLAPP